MNKNKKRFSGELPFPLKYMDKFNKDYPHIWEICDVYMKLVCDKFVWDSRAFCPLDVFRELVYGYNYQNKKQVQDVYVASLCSIYNWKRYKQIYTFDKDFVNILIDSHINDDNIDIDNVIKTLPYNTFYIDINGESNIVIDDLYVSNDKVIKGGAVTGFFIYFNTTIYEKTNPEKDKPSTTIHFDVYTKTGSFGYELIVDKGLSISESFNRLRTDILTSSKNTEKSVQNCEIMESVVSKLLKLIMYICTINSDVKKSSRQQSVRNSAIVSNSKFVVNTANSIKLSDVGFTIGKAIRLYNKNAENNNNDEDSETTVTTKPRKSTAKRPHIRRGHFHHYWIGKADNRQLILKWVAPTFIHVTNKELIANITPVEL